MEAFDLILIVIWVGWLVLIALAVALCAVSSRADEHSHGPIQVSIREAGSTAAQRGPRSGGRFERAHTGRTEGATVS
jgi:hypothetical protein